MTILLGKKDTDDLLTDGVVTTGKVVGGVFLTGDQLLRVEELTVGARAHLIDDGGLCDIFGAFALISSGLHFFACNDRFYDSILRLMTTGMQKKLPRSTNTVRGTSL